MRMEGRYLRSNECVRNEGIIITWYSLADANEMMCNSCLICLTQILSTRAKSVCKSHQICKNKGIFRVRNKWGGPDVSVCSCFRYVSNFDLHGSVNLRSLVMFKISFSSLISFLNLALMNNLISVVKRLPESATLLVCSDCVSKREQSYSSRSIRNRYQLGINLLLLYLFTCGAAIFDTINFECIFYMRLLPYKQSDQDIQYIRTWVKF